MDKLISLKDKPATIEDIGKFFYNTSGNKHDIDCLSDFKVINRVGHLFFWQPLRIIAESEYRQLTAKLEATQTELDENRKASVALFKSVGMLNKRQEEVKLENLGLRAKNCEVRVKLEEAVRLLNLLNHDVLLPVDISLDIEKYLQDYSKVEK